MTFTEENHAGMLPTDSRWTVTYAIAPANNAISITFALLQNRSLLLAQQEAHNMVLVTTIKTIFELKLIDQDDANAEEDDEFVRFKTIRVRTDHLVTLIEDEGSMARDYLLCLDEAEKAVVLKQIVAYADMLVIDLKAVRAERDDNNLPRELVSPPVLTGELIRLRPAYFIRDVLDPHRERILRFWSAEDIDQFEKDHRQLVAAYKNGPILRCAIDEHDVKTTFDDAWDVAPGKYLRLRTFCGGLATADSNRTDLMHFSLEDIFQAKQCALLQ
ncbi:unnamed protein product [Hyaloperonospora brassicae]|uniref:Uncharacterized protein n=1 Tax=Hyaloperonospora brassicae TaxID=162125 RepID=A0AAV0T8S6_HYABA|nr:unnamed protein product [Hyaloperonospora brassicae]